MHKLEVNSSKLFAKCARTGTKMHQGPEWICLPTLFFIIVLPVSSFCVAINISFGILALIILSCLFLCRFFIVEALFAAFHFYALFVSASCFRFCCINRYTHVDHYLRVGKLCAIETRHVYARGGGEKGRHLSPRLLVFQKPAAEVRSACELSWKVQVMVVIYWTYRHR